MPDIHAMLSASGAHRWLHCTPSAKLEAELPDKSSEAAEQGTAAHALAEYKLRKALGEKDLTRPESDWEDEAMRSHTDDYAEFVLERLVEVKARCADPLLLIEERLDFSHVVLEGFGTGDCVIVAEPTLEIIDFKYGTGVLVEAENNPQMRLYALGALATYENLYDISAVRMTIFQPRRNNVSTTEMDVQDLKAWGEEVVKPLAKLAFNGGGDFNAGSWCQFCKVGTTCKARAKQEMELISKYFEPEDTELTDTDIADILTRAPGFKKWLSAIETYALEAALSGEKTWPGFKLVAGRAVRKYTDEQAVAEVLQEAGWAENEIFTKKLLGITAMEKQVGKKKFTELLKDLIHTPAGKPALVPESDKRPPLEVKPVAEMFEIITD